MAKWAFLSHKWQKTSLRGQKRDLFHRKRCSNFVFLAISPVLLLQILYYSLLCLHSTRAWQHPVARCSGIELAPESDSVIIVMSHISLPLEELPEAFSQGGAPGPWAPSSALSAILFETVKFLFLWQCPASLQPSISIKNRTKVWRQRSGITHWYLQPSATGTGKAGSWLSLAQLLVQWKHTS